MTDAQKDTLRRVLVLLLALAAKALNDVAFVGFGVVALLGVWHFSPSIALILGGLGGMAYMVLFGGGGKKQ